MNTTTILTEDQLLSDRKQLVEQLDGTNHKEVYAKIKNIDAAIKELRKVNLLKKVNGKYSRLRQLALQAWECEQPTEDIITNDGSFHKTKVKKYPKIAALQYASATWEDNKITKFNINGETFYMFRTKHEYNKPTEYTRPETFSEFLKFNTIPENDITIEQYNELCSKLNELNEKLKKDIESYNNGLKELNTSSFNYWGLVGQHNVHLYEYTPNN